MVGGRIEWIDLAKAVAIIAIIVGHFTAFFLTVLPAAGPVFRFMDSFHVPLFFLLSGFCMSAPLGWERTVRLAKQCLVPYAFCGALCIVVCVFTVDGFRLEEHLFGFFYGAGAYRDHILFGDPAVVQSIGVLWFLPCLLFGKIFASLCLRLERFARWLPLAAAFAMFMVGALTAPLLFLPWDIQPALAAAWFICCGSMLGRYGVLERKGLRRGLQMAGALYVGGVSAGLFGDPMYCNSTYHQPVIDGIGCACAAVLVMGAARALERLPERIEHGLSWVGRNTLAIFCFHAISLAPGDYLKWDLLGLVSAGANPVLVLVGALVIDAALSIFFAWAALRTPGIRRIFGGKKVAPCSSGSSRQRPSAAS